MHNSNRKLEILSVIGLLFAALFWGASYPATKAVSDCPTFYIISVRFAIAAVALGLLFIGRFKNFNREILKYAFLLSIFVTAMYIFATIGIKYTTSARASFFTCLTFIIVPFLNLVFYKTKINKVTLISVAICLMGIFLLSYSPGMGFGFNLGDFLCVLGSVAGSLHIVFLERVTKKESMDPMLFTTLLMAFVALWGTLIAFFNGDFFSFTANGFQLGIMAFLGVFSCAAAFLLQSICQKYVPSNRVGVILAMEPASGCVISVLVLGETMGATGWVGAVTVMISLLYMEIATSYFNNKPPTHK